jgi:hypothetical protein
MTDVFVARLDPTGAVVWSRVVPGTRTGFIASGRGAGVVVDATDGVVLTGSFDGTTDCGGGTLVSGSDDAEAAFVARFDGAGAHVWSTSLAAVDGDTSGERVAIDGTGAIVFAGDLRGRLDLAGTTLESEPFPARAFLAKFDAAGQPMTARLFPAPPFEGASQVVEAMVPDPSNGAFMVAAAYKGEVVDAKQVLHLDDAGAGSWAKDLPFFDNGSMYSVLAADAEGGFGTSTAATPRSARSPPPAGWAMRFRTAMSSPPASMDRARWRGAAGGAPNAGGTTVRPRRLTEKDG